MVWDKNFASSGLCRDVSIPDWRIENPITALDPSLHLLPHLATILFPLKLPLRSKNGFNELALGSVLEPVVKAFDYGPI